MDHEDYLACSEYEGKPAHPSEPGFTAFYDEKTKLHYFALLDADGKVLLRSEGYAQESAREKGLASVKKNRTNRAQYDAVKWEGGGYVLALRAGNDFRIAVSCPFNTEAEALALIPFATGEKVRSARAAAGAQPTGKKWLWWLLLLLILALLVWFFWPKSGCRPETPVPPSTVQEPVAPAPVPPKEPRREVLHSIFFGFGSWALDSPSKTELDRMAGILKENSGMTGVLRGHADAIGGDRFNDALSLRRADAAKAYLVSVGIEGSRLTTEGMGKRHPIAANSLRGHDAPEGRQLNRRVELVATGGDEKVIVVVSAAPEVPDRLKLR